MPDIAMCKNEECNIKENCYRYKAIPSCMQSYCSSFKQNEKGKCENYWQITDEFVDKRI